MSGVSSAVKGIVSSQLFMLVTMIISLVGTPIVLSLVNKEEYGLWILLSQVVSYFTYLDFGLSAGITRMLASNRDSPDHIISQILSTSFITFLGIGLVVFFAGAISVPFVQESLHISDSLLEVSYSIFISLLVLTAIQLPFRCISSIFYAHQKQLLSNILQFVIGIISMPMNIILLYMDFGLWAFVITNCTTAVLNVIIYSYYFKKHYPTIRVSLKYYQGALLPQLYSYGFFIFLNGIAWVIVSSTDRMLIGSLISLTAVTIFSLSVRLPEIVLGLIFKITDNFFPMMTELNEKNELGSFKTIHNNLMLISITVASTAAWSLYILDELFVLYWVGSGNFIGQPVIAAVLLLMVIHSILHVSAVCLNGAGFVKGFSLLSLLEAGLNLGLSILLGKMYGVLGIMCGTIIASVLTSGWYTPYLAMKFMKINFYEYLFNPILKPLIITALPGLLMIGVKWYFNSFFSTSVWAFILLAAITGLLYIVVLWVAILKPAFPTLVSKIKSKLS